MASGGVVASSGWSYITLPGYLKQVFFETWDEIPEQYSRAFSVQNSDRADERYQFVAGVGLWPEKQSLGAIPYDTLDESTLVTFTHTEYAEGIMVERKYVDDEKYGIIRQLPENLARVGRAKVETVAADVLNNSFTTACYDGQYLCDDDHPYAKSGTGDNLATAAYSEASLKSMITQGRGQKDTAGYVKIQAFNGKLNMIGPPDLEFDMYETVKKQIYQAHQADYTPNVVGGRFNEPIIMDYLTSTTAFWIQDPRLHKLLFFWRVRPEFKKEENFDTLIHKWRGYMRFCAGAADWRGLVGSTGVA